MITICIVALVWALCIAGNGWLIWRSVDDVTLSHVAMVLIFAAIAPIAFLIGLIRAMRRYRHLEAQ